jgi:hypothetical protein
MIFIAHVKFYLVEFEHLNGTIMYPGFKYIHFYTPVYWGTDDSWYYKNKETKES